VAVLGPGASNNSTLDGSLITTISFGIPASVFMAILIGAFIMHGVVPGPDMLRPESQGGHLGLTYSFVWIVVISNIITVGIIFLLLKQIIKVTTIRGSLLIPFILMLVYLGAFAEKNVFPDLILVLIFGGLGWVLEKLKWPRPPLILGLVLGGLAESRLFLSVGNYGLSWIWRPMVLVIIAVTLVGVLYSVFKGRKEKKKRRMAEAVDSDSENKVTAKAMMNKRPAVFALCLVIVLALALWQSRNFNIRAGLFPWAIGFPLLGLSILQFIREFRGKTGIGPRRRHVKEEGQGLPADVVNRRTRDMFG
jgi:putative tricarboxylic transport membrane protein